MKTLDSKAAPVTTLCPCDFTENWELTPGLSWTLPCAPFPFADLNRYPFAVTVSLTASLSPESCETTTGLRVVLATPD